MSVCWHVSLYLAWDLSTTETFLDLLCALNRGENIVLCTCTPHQYVSCYRSIFPLNGCLDEALNIWSLAWEIIVFHRHSQCSRYKREFVITFHFPHLGVSVRLVVVIVKQTVYVTVGIHIVRVLMFMVSKFAGTWILSLEKKR